MRLTGKGLWAKAVKEYLIVDGYNIINAWPGLKDLKDEDLDYARSKLISILSEHAALTGRKTTVIFDAYLVKGNTGNKETIGGIDVIYTKEGITADMAIERMTALLPKHSKVFVATSDRLQQETIWGKGAFRISAMELYREVQMAKADHRKRTTPKTYAPNRLEDQLPPEIREKLEKMRLDWKE